MNYSFRLIFDKQESELLLGIENQNNNELINKINKVLYNRNPSKECVPINDKTRLAFLNYNSFKYFLFGLCSLTLSDIEQLDKYGIKVQKLNLMVFSSGLSKMFTSYYDDEVEECEEVSLSSIFENDNDIQYSIIQQPYIYKDDLKYYKSKYGNYAKMNF